MRRLARQPVALLAALALAGCGAKTGLLLPDAEPPPEEPEPVEICVEVDPETMETELELDVTTRLLSADVFFLIDCTGSMQGEIANIQRGLTSRIVPGAVRQIPDVRFGVGAFADFPIPDYGNPPDRAFEMRRAVTDDIAAVQAAIDDLPDWIGGDDPEAQVEALYQTATGEGLGGFISPSPGCPRRGLGYPCFREGSQPVVVLITDAPFHNGPGGDHPYNRPWPLIDPAPHDFADAVSALDALRARVIGINSGEARQHLEVVARQTGAVDGAGAPLVYNIGPSGDRLSDEVVRGIEDLALRVPLDVDAIAVDVGGDDLDATILVHAIIAERAEPATGVERVEENTFYNVTPGTRLFFSLDIRVDVIPTPARTTVYPVLIRFRGNRVSVLHEQIVYIAVPGLDGADGC